MGYQNLTLIARYKARINDIGRKISVLNAKKEVIKKTKILPSRKELEALELVSVKRKNLIKDNKAS